MWGPHFGFFSILLPPSPAPIIYSVSVSSFENLRGVDSEEDILVYCYRAKRLRLIALAF